MIYPEPDLNGGLVVVAVAEPVEAVVVVADPPPRPNKLEKNPPDF